MSKIPIYFLPGLAAGPEIFENLRLSNSVYDLYYLQWKMPLHQKETVANYAMRMCEDILHKNPVLVGVSFGGIMVQEMSQFITTKKVIIISSVKSRQELPLHLQLAGTTKAYKFVPTSLFAQNIDLLSKYAIGKPIVKRLDLYKQYLSITDKRYLDWAIKQVVSWSQEVSDPNLIHIHGNKDIIFPIDKIDDCIVVEGGTHIMILNKFKWLNENLPNLILG